MNYLAGAVTNTSNVLSISINQAHNSPSTTAIINAESTSLNVGDEVNISMGYEGTSLPIFTGYVKIIEKAVPDNTYTITCNDKLIRAIDYFIASNTPDEKYTRQNVSAEDLVGDMLNLAGITGGDYDHGTTYFTFGITRPVEVNLVSSYDMSKQVADILAWHLWCDNEGIIHFRDRKPYVMDGDTSQKTITVNELTHITHRKSDRDLRNRVVVYGAEGINAHAEAESPYLPTGFRKSVVVASPWIDDQSMAQNAADWNLTKLNRLTEEISIEIIGDSSIHARHVLTVVDSYTNTSGDWYVFTCEHRWGDAGYTTTMELRK